MKRAGSASDPYNPDSVMNRLGPSRHTSSDTSDNYNDTYSEGYRGGRGRGVSRGHPRGRGGRSTSGAYPTQGVTPFVRRSNEDRDGDMSMGSDSSQIDISLQGWQGAADQDAVLQFIKRKVERPVQISNVRYEGDKMIFSVLHVGQASSVLKLSGIRFAGDKLLFERLNSATPSISMSVTPQPSVIQNLDQDPTLKQSGIDGYSSSGGLLSNSKSKIGPVICKLIGDLFPEVESISFASNNLSSLKLLDSLPSRVPNVVNLSFQNNKLHSYRDIDCFPGKDLKHLREIMFMDNPIRDNQTNRAGGELRYQGDMKKIFPSIQILDQQPLVEEVKFNISSAPTASLKSEITLPGPGPAFVDTTITYQTCTDFIEKYFGYFDGQRAALVDLYDAHSTFSVSVNTQFVHRESRRKDDFDGWWNVSRNLAKVASTDKRIQYIKHGAADIIQLLCTLPSTKHDKLISSNLSIMDAFQRPIGTSNAIMLLLVIHGSFNETNTTSHRFNTHVRHGEGETGTLKRSFDRCFTIVPSAPGSRSANAGYPYTVLNDQLVVRMYHDRPTWKEAANVHSLDSGAQIAPNRSTVNQNEMAELSVLKQQHNLSDAQCQLILDFMQQTNLNVNYAWQCISQTGWVVGNAMQAFINAKHQLPKEAFRN